MRFLHVNRGEQGWRVYLGGGFLLCSPHWGCAGILQVLMGLSLSHSNFTQLQRVSLAWLSGKCLTFRESWDVLLVLRCRLGSIKVAHTQPAGTMCNTKLITVLATGQLNNCICCCMLFYMTLYCYTRCCLCNHKECSIVVMVMNMVVLCSVWQCNEQL